METNETGKRTVLRAAEAEITQVLAGVEEGTDP